MYALLCGTVNPIQHFCVCLKPISFLFFFQYSIFKTLSNFKQNCCCCTALKLLIIWSVTCSQRAITAVWEELNRGLQAELVQGPGLQSWPWVTWRNRLMTWTQDTNLRFGQHFSSSGFDVSGTKWPSQRLCGSGKHHRWYPKSPHSVHELIRCRELTLCAETDNPAKGLGCSVLS